MAAKRKGKRAKSLVKKDIIRKPGIPGICIICGGVIDKRRDKKGRMYIRCSFCGAWMFLNHFTCEVGYQIVEEAISKDIAGFRQRIEQELVKVFEKKSSSEREKEIKKLIKEVRSKKIL